MGKALVVLSGGQDSTTCAVLAKQIHGVDVAAVTFNYNQRHSRELIAARHVANLLDIEHEIVDVGPILKGTSPLTDPNQQLETYQDFETMDKIIGDRVEKTFVPMRNALFLTLAANRAVCMGADSIYTGVCQADNANYPDCRLDFIHAQQEAINEALGRHDIYIVTPLLMVSKAESIRMLWNTGIENFALLAFTHTAYDGTYPPVSKDHASVLRAQGFLESGYPDPLVVRAYLEGAMELPETPNYRLMGDIPEAIGRLKKRLQAMAYAAARGYEPTADEGSEA